MSGGYILVAGILWYFLVVRMMDAVAIRPAKAATMVIAGYYALYVSVSGLEFWLRGQPLLNLLSLSLLVTAVVQYMTARVVFMKLEETGDEYLSYACWGGAGLALLFFIIPSVVQAMMAL